MSDLQVRTHTPAKLVSCSALAELAQLDQWVISKYVEGRDKDGNIKWDKPPFSPNTKRKCSHSNPSDWSSHEVALNALPDFDWLGFVFTKYDPYSGIDLDGCRDPETGEIEAWAQGIIGRLDSYTEISPSGKGVKIWVRGTLPKQFAYSMGKHKGIEIYSEKRFFTVTGQHLAGTSLEINDVQGVLDAIVQEYAPAPKPAQPRKAYKVSRGEAANERQNVRDVIVRMNRANDLGDYLEHQGAMLVRTSGDVRYYSGLHGDSHSHSITYIVSPANDGNGHIGYSYSPNGKLSKTDFPRGFRWFDAICALEYGGGVVDALKALNPIQPREAPLAESQIHYQTVAQARDAARKRAQRRHEAAETLADVRARAEADSSLTPADRAVLNVLLDIAERSTGGPRDWCRPSKQRIAEMCAAAGRPYSVGSVKRALMRLEARGYFKSEGDGGGPNQTAIRTFLRGSSARAEVDEMIPVSCRTCNLESDSRSCEPPAVAHQPAQPALVDLDALADEVRHLSWKLSDPQRHIFAFGEMPVTELATLAAFYRALEAEGLDLAVQSEPADAPPLTSLPAPLVPTLAEMDSEAPGASYTPVELPDVPYSNTSIERYLSLAERNAYALAMMRRRPDAGDQPEELPLDRPEPKPRRTTAKEQKPSAIDRYVVELALMKNTQLAGELRKHRRTLEKHAGTHWLGQVRAKLALVQAEIDQRAVPTVEPQLAATELGGSRVGPPHMLLGHDTQLTLFAQQEVTTYGAAEHQPKLAAQRGMGRKGLHVLRPSGGRGAKTWSNGRR